MRDVIRKYFPALNEFHFLQDVEQHASLVEFQDKDVVMESGRSLSSIYLLHEGGIKVSRINEDEGEVFLYYLLPGDMCAVSFICASQNRLSQVRAIAVEPCKAIALPTSRVHQWSMEHKCWHQFTMDTMRERFDEMLNVIDSIAFRKLDDRIIEYLEKTCYSHSDHELKITHNDIAAALNTSREVVSRLLKRLEIDGKVRLHRSNVELLCHKGHLPQFCPIHCDKCQ
jgi:CRP/FNR family transcriptional regulator, anaerobic regulatory protein